MFNDHAPSTPSGAEPNATAATPAHITHTLRPNGAMETNMTNPAMEEPCGAPDEPAQTDAPASQTQHVEFTLVTSNDPCSKRIWLRRDGRVDSEPACAISAGNAQRIRVDELPGETPLLAVAELIKSMKANEALALGRIVEGVGDNPAVVTEKCRAEQPKPNTISRTQQYLEYKSDAPGVMLVDFDQKWMPQSIKERIERARGAWNTLAEVIPALAVTGHISRASTSAGIYNTKTGKQILGSGGEHHFMIVADGSDVPRALKDLHDRAWLYDLGWYGISRAGKPLERSIVDKSVGGPERLVFEGAPTVVPPLMQDLSARNPVVVEGAILDTRTAIPPLTAAERDIVRAKKEAAWRLRKPEADQIRAQSDRTQAERSSKKTGVDYNAALRDIETRHEDTLPPVWLLEFDDPKIGVKSVGDVLANPEHYVGKSLADPHEGVAYGRGRAKVMRRLDGTLFVGTFAHGGGAYDLGPDREGKLPEPIDMDAVLRVRKDGKLPADLQQKFDGACRFRGRLGQLWREEVTPGNGSPYEFAYELVWHLKPYGTFTPTEYAMIVSIRDQQSNAEELEQRVARCWVNCRQSYGPAGFEDESRNSEREAAADDATTGSTQDDAETSRGATDEAKAEAKPKTGKFYWLRADEAARRALAEPCEPLLENVMNCDTEAVLIGKPGGGKTFGVLDWFYHGAKGLPWAGLGTKQGAYVFLAAEAQAKINDRIAALEKKYGPLGDTPLFVIPVAPDLAHGVKDTQDLIAALVAIEKECGQKIRIVAVDTLARAMAGGNENNPQDMGAVINATGFIRTLVKCASLLVHHPGWDEKRGRGHSSLLGAVDTEMQMDKGILKVTKFRDGADGHEIRVILERVKIGTDPKGRERTSCTVTARPGNAPPETPMELTPAEDEVLTVIDDALPESDKPEDRVFKSAQAVAWVREARNCRDGDSKTSVSKQTVSGHLRALSEKGWIQKHGHGAWSLASVRQA